MNKLLRSIMLVCIVLILVGCNNKENKKEPKTVTMLRKAHNKMENYEYEEALKLLEEFDQIYPDQQVGELNTSMLRLKCYEAMGDFENAKVEYVKVINKIVPGPIMMEYGIGLYEIYLVRYLFKAYNIEDGVYILNKFSDIIAVMNSEIDSQKYAKMTTLFIPNIINSRVDLVMVTLLNYHYMINTITSDPTYFTDDVEDNIRRTEIQLVILKDETMEKLDKRIDYMFNYIASCNEKDRNYERVLLGLIDYKDIEGNYHSDIVWSRDITKKHFQKLADDGVITKKTLETIKSKVFRDKLPEDFIALFDEFCQ